MEAFAPYWPAAIAVSGGSDSVALMLLLAEWARKTNRVPPTVLSVDHGLRPGSRKDAERVRKLAVNEGLSAHILIWKGTKPSSDVEAEARLARYSLMGVWCREHRIPAVYLGHTLDDQAETFLLRLARGSGLDGLAGMQRISMLPVPEFQPIKLIRPLLAMRRAELQEYLTARKVVWSDDPMNADPQFSRARLRQSWTLLAELNLTPERIAGAAEHLARARAALEDLTEGFLKRGAHFDENRAMLDPLRLGMLPREIGLRSLAAVLCRVSGQAYRPRFDSLERLFDCIVSGFLGGGATLHGCIVAVAPISNQIFGSATITVSREPGRKPVEPPGRLPRTTSNRKRAG